jgi:hypothetical protein
MKIVNLAISIEDLKNRENVNANFAMLIFQFSLIFLKRRFLWKSS